MTRLVALALLSLTASCAANTVTLSDRFTADPAPIVVDGRLYISTSHDLPDQRGWLMTDYSLMSTDDLANWRDDGIIFDLKNQSWGRYAWAQQVIETLDGQFYMCARTTLRPPAACDPTTLTPNPTRAPRPLNQQTTPR
jgi:hypothetical protein